MNYCEFLDRQTSPITLDALKRIGFKTTQVNQTDVTLEFSDFACRCVFEISNGTKFEWSHKGERIEGPKMLGSLDDLLRMMAKRIRK